MSPSHTRTDPLIGYRELVASLIPSHYWRLDEDAGTLDAIDYGNDVNSLPLLYHYTASQVFVVVLVVGVDV